MSTAERLVNLIAVYYILSWRIFWMTMINRTAPNAEPEIALSEAETNLLDELIPDRDQGPPRPRSLSSYLIKIAKLSGYLARANDPPPGNTVMWRGMSRLTDISLGAMITAGKCG